MKLEQRVVYFNNCHNRDHVRWFGSRAFFDLSPSGRQGAQARNLSPGQCCVVAKRSVAERRDNRIIFDWYSFNYEALLPDERGAPDRVLFGRMFASETLAKEAAAHSERYAPLFRVNGYLKIGSVFHKAIPSQVIPSGTVGESTYAGDNFAMVQSGAGFGDPAENKLVESAAIRTVRTSYEEDGWLVQSRERDKCGFDLECSKMGALEQVEVKGVRGTGLSFVITAGEIGQARNNSKFFLVVVTEALTESPKLTKFSGVDFCRRFNLSAIQYRAALKL
jgi:hypothetical protein